MGVGENMSLGCGGRGKMSDGKMRREWRGGVNGKRSRRDAKRRGGVRRQRGSGGGGGA